MRKVEGDEAAAAMDTGLNNHGAPSFYHTFRREDIGDPNADSDVPTSQFFSEGNGGEFRKSYHGYPKGMAQFIESPTTFHIQPMQIDTKNRHYNGSDFKADLLPAASEAPPGAPYSGLLECPCTDRIEKTIEVQYTTQSQGACATAVTNATECFIAASKVQSGGVAANSTVSSTVLPGDCSLIKYQNGTTIAYFNEEKSKSACGGGQVTQSVGLIAVVGFHRLLHGARRLQRLGLRHAGLQHPRRPRHPHPLRSKQQLVRHRLRQSQLCHGRQALHPSCGWEVSGLQTTLLRFSRGNIEERKLGDHDPGTKLATSLRVTSNTVADGVRTMVVTRPLQGKTSDHYTFSTSIPTIPLLVACGNGSAYAYHGPKQR
jgi:hypothetical protein